MECSFYSPYFMIGFMFLLFYSTLKKGVRTLCIPLDALGYTFSKALAVSTAICMVPDEARPAGIEQE
jgi:hypothetical protein